MTAPAQSATPTGFVEVAVPVPLRRLFTYAVPPALQGALERGCRVAVPFGPRKLAGIVVGPAEAPAPGTRIKPVAGPLLLTPGCPRAYSLSRPSSKGCS